jgi:hypothetical protein
MIEDAAMILSFVHGLIIEHQDLPIGFAVYF